MTRQGSIGDLLQRHAQGTGPAAAKELEKAAKNLVSFSRAPSDRRAAGCIAAVPTPAAVGARQSSKSILSRGLYPRGCRRYLGTVPASSRKHLSLRSIR